jgi:hypothetical protein
MDGLKWWCLATLLAFAKTFRVFTRSCLSAGRVNFLIHSALRSIFNPAICASPVFCSTTTATTPNKEKRTDTLKALTRPS